MTSKDIKAILREELKSLNDLSNVHGLDLNHCLIEPVKQIFISSIDKNITFELWTVLEEAKDKSGYKITFDEDDKSFGLGILTDMDELMDMGTYGTFLETLKGM